VSSPTDTQTYLTGPGSPAARAAVNRTMAVTVCRKQRRAFDALTRSSRTARHSVT